MLARWWRTRNFPDDCERVKIRLDKLLVDRGLTPSRERAQALILAGKILVNGQKLEKAGAAVQALTGTDLNFDLQLSGDLAGQDKDLPHLFEAFHRGSNVGDIPGTGLGLVIIKLCVDLHGGSIQVKSSPGEGSTFIVRIPAWV